MFLGKISIICNPLAATDLIKKHIHSHLWNEEQTICPFNKVLLLSSEKYILLDCYLIKHFEELFKENLIIIIIP